jgi:hypothetical protein
MIPIPTIAQVNRMNVATLRMYLEAFGESTLGTKKQLQPRLRDWVKENRPTMGSGYDDEDADMEQGSGLYMGARPVSDFQGTRANYRTVGSGMTINKSTKFVRRNGKILGKLGAGIAPNNEMKNYARYREFGRYYIHVPSLAKCMMNIKYPSKIQVMDLPQRFVSQEFINMIQHILDTGVWDKSQFNKLSEDEQDYFIIVARKCQFDGTIGMGARLSKKESAEHERFELLKGTVIAGNNSPEVLSELKTYILKFLNDGRLPKKTGHDLLYEIACL